MNRLVRVFLLLVLLAAQVVVAGTEGIDSRSKPLPAAVSRPGGTTSHTNFQKDAELIVNLVQGPIWNFDTDQIKQVLKDGITRQDFLAIDVQENSGATSFAVWRDRDNNVQLSEKKSLPEGIRQQAGERITRPLIANGKEFARLTFYVKTVAGPLQLTAAERAYLIKKGSIRMCVLPDWLPYLGINESGAATGIGADMVALMQQRLGVTFELHPTREWNDSLAAIRARNCDILPLASDIPDHHAAMNFSRPYLTTPLVIATRINELFFRDGSEIGDRKIGIVKGYSFATLLRQRYPNIQIVEVDGIRDGLNRVSKGKIWGYLDGMDSIAYSLQKHSMHDLKITGKLEFDLDLSVASRNDEELLSAIMQKATNSISEEERRAIVSKWIAVRVDQGFDYALLWKLGVAAALLLLGAYAWNRRLARFNKQLELAQSALRQTASELEAILDHAWIGIFVTSGERNIVRMNHYAERLFQCGPGGYIGQSTRSLFSGDQDYDAFTQKVRAAAAANVSVEYSFCRKDGRSFLAKSVGSLLDPANPGKGAIWLVTDITEQRAAEEKLAQTLSELDIIFRNVGIGIGYTKDRRFVRVNSELIEMTGYSESDLIGKTGQLYLSEEAYQSVGRGYAVMATGQTFRVEVPMRRADGTSFLCVHTGTLLDPGDPSRASIWTYQDITAERAAERRLERTLNELEIIFQNASIGIAFVQDRRIVRVNSAFSKMSGFEPAALIGQSTRIYYPSDEAWQALAVAYDVFAGGQTVFKREVMMRRADGTDLLCAITGSPVDPDDLAKGAIWLHQDITEQRAAEDKLTQALSELNIIFNNASVAIAFLVDRRFVRVNRAFETTSGWSAAELFGQTGRRFYKSDEVYEAIGKSIGELAGGEALRLDVEIRCADGREILCEAVCSYVDPSDRTKGMVWLYADVTELRQAQAALQSARDDALTRNALIEQQHQLVTHTLDQVATLLNNSGEGFLSFGRDLMIEEGFSRECQRIFGRDLLDLPLPALLCPEDVTQRGFVQKTLRLIMDSADNPLRRDAYLGLLPAEYRLGERYCKAEYRLLDDRRMMLILTDVSDQKQLEQRLALERLRLEFVVHALENRDDLLEMLRDFDDFRSRILPDLLSFERQPSVLLAEVFRQIHTFKSLFAQASLPTIPEVLHELESRLGQLRDLGKSLDNNAIKRELGTTDLGAALEQDLALLRQKLGDDFFNSEREIRVPASKLASLEEEASTLYGSDSRMLGLIRYLRYVPLHVLIEPHSKAAEQLAQRQDKLLAPIIFSGDAAPVDPEVYGPFCKSLVHLFRNAVDHGIEDVDTRLMADKSETATIRCAVQTTGSQLTLTIVDDGRGIDAGLLRAKAIEQGKAGAGETASMSDADALMLIFADGVTTSEEITAISGRGVGLGAVQQELMHLGGTVRVESVLGQGTRFEFTLPYQPPVVAKAQATGYASARKFLSPLPGVVQAFCKSHLKLEVTVDATLHEFTADRLFDFTALLSLGVGLNASIGLSIERPLLLEMTRRFEPDFPEDEIEELADSVGAEIANTLVGNATVYFTHLAHHVAMGTPDIISPSERAATIGTRAFRGFMGRADAGSFMIFCLLTEENPV